MTGADLLVSLKEKTRGHAKAKEANARSDWPAKHVATMLEAAENGASECRIYGSSVYIAATEKLAEADGFQTWVCENGTCLVVKW